MALDPLPLDGPVVLRIAADAQRAPTDYVNDHIWEVVAGGDPAALALTTSFGRRAARMRLFPSFGMGGPIALDPASFDGAPSLEGILPSYLRLRFSPLPGLEVTYEVRAQDSTTVCGRISLANRTDHFRPVRLAMHGELTPLPGGQVMLPRSLTGVTCLVGRTADLAPVLFLTGGAVEEPGVASGLVVRAELAPGATKAFVWAAAAATSPEASFLQAREAAGRPWDAETARLERIHGRWVEVHSGDPEWDAAFHLAQQNVLNGLVGPAAHASAPTLVLERSPDRGYSVGGDGRDYDVEWIGPSALEAYLIVNQLLWAAPERAADLLRAFWSSQGPDGTIDARPGPAGQRSRRMCPPLLATLTRRVDEVLQDDGFLEEGFRALWPFFRLWFSPPHDRDGDGWPEWDVPAHLPWPMWWASEGPDSWVETSVVEDPALLALLYREAESLEAMAQRLGRGEASRELAARRGQLRALLTRAWSEARGTFLRVEREGHGTSTGQPIASGAGPAKTAGIGALDVPGRLAIRLGASEAEASGVRLRVRGRLESGRVRVETIDGGRVRWHWDRGWATSDLIFASVESVEVSGVPPSVGWAVTTLDLAREDLSLFLPLWAGMLDRAQADRLVRGSLMDPRRYLRPGGWAPVPDSGRGGDPPSDDPRQGIHVALNVMLAEGLIQYGYRREAADVLGRLVRGGLQAMRATHGLSQSFDPESLRPIGKRHHLTGVPPLSLYLRALGVGLRSPRVVEIDGHSPFEGEAVVRWRGLEVRRGAAETLVTFPSGAVARARPPDRVLVEELPGESESGAG